jgi:6-phosphogluconolactonase
MSAPSPPAAGHVAFRHFPDVATLAAALAGEIASWLADAVIARGHATLVVPGGTTPGPLFDALCDADMPWADVTITVSDERRVDASAAASNERQVRDRLLEGRARKARFVSWRSAAEHPDAATKALQATLAPLLPVDVCVLGLGLDGHIASLIPGADGFESAMRERVTVLPIHAPGAAGAADRLTLTFSAIAASRHVVLLFTGHAKRVVFENAMAGVGAAPIVRLVREARHPVFVFWASEAPS